MLDVEKVARMWASIGGAMEWTMPSKFQSGSKRMSASTGTHDVITSVRSECVT